MSDIRNRIGIHLHQLRVIPSDPSVIIEHMEEVKSLIAQETANMAAEMFVYSTPRIPLGTFFLRELTANLAKMDFDLNQISIAINHATKFLNEKV